MVREMEYRSRKLRPIRLETPVTGSPSRGLHASLNFLRDNWHEPITVDDLTKASTLSRRGFQKAFQRHTGYSPGRELRRIRIERGKALLAGTDDSLEIVARRCGYRSSNSFWVAFRRATGISPGKYRSRFQRA